MSYAQVASRAGNLVARKGAAIAFARSTVSISETTSIAGAPSSSSIAGNAVQAKEDPKRYERLSLEMGGKRTLFFTPSTYGDKVLPSDSATWGSVSVTVEGVEHIAPDGVVIGSFVIVSP